MTPLKAVSSPSPSYKPQPNSSLLSQLTADNFSLITAFVGIEFNKFARTCHQLACLIAEQGTWHLLAEARLSKETLHHLRNSKSAVLWRDLTKKHAGFSLAHALLAHQAVASYQPMPGPMLIAETQDFHFFTQNLVRNTSLGNFAGREIGQYKRRTFTNEPPTHPLNYRLPKVQGTNTIECIVTSGALVAAVEKQWDANLRRPFSKQIHVWKKGETGKTLKTLDLPPFSVTFDLRLQDTKLFLARSYHMPLETAQVVVIYDVETGKEVLNLKPVSNEGLEGVEQIEPMDSHVFLANHLRASGPQAIKLWDIRSPQQSVRDFQFDHLQDSHCIRFCASSTTLYTASATQEMANNSDGFIRNWDMGNGRCIKRVTTRQDRTCRLTMGGEILYTGTYKGTVRVWNCSQLSFRGKFTLPTPNPHQINYMHATPDYLHLFSSENREVATRLHPDRWWEFDLTALPLAPPPTPAGSSAAAAGAGAGAARPAAS